MDYGNALMYGVNASIVSKLQRVQNTAARLVTRKKKYEHIIPTLVALHWIPFKFDASINCYCTHSKPCMDLLLLILGNSYIFTNRCDPCDFKVLR